jgi:hypothetical protein
MAFTQDGTSYTDVSGARLTSGVGSSAAMRDVQESMVIYKPYQTPLVSGLITNKLGKKPTGNIKFEWMYSTLLPRTDTVTWTGTSASEDAITVGDSTLWKVGTKVVVDTTGEVVIVDSIAGGNIDVTKIGSGVMTVAVALTVHFLGTSFEQGTSSATAVSVNKEFAYNYVENYKKAVNSTETQMATAEYGPVDWDTQKMGRMEEFLMDVESNFLFGIRSSFTGLQTGSATQYTMGGIMLDTSAAYIYNSENYAGATPSEAWFFGTCLKNVFAKGSNRKKLYCGSNLKMAITDYSKVKQQTTVEERSYGAVIRTIECDFGILDIQWHPMLDGTVYSKRGFFLDQGEQYLKYRYLAANGLNRDFRYKEYPHFEEQEQRKGEWKAEIGMQLEGSEYHRLIQPA